MKKKILALFLAGAVVLAGANLAQGVSLATGPGIIKTWNYEIGTSYSGGTSGTFYFRDAAASYTTEEHGLLTYDALNPNHKLFSDLNVIRASDNEDAWGLLRITNIFYGDITGSDSRFGDGNDGTPIGNNITSNTSYWSEGNNGEYLLGMFYGHQDLIVECVNDATNQYRVWGEGGEFDIYVVDGFPGNPSIAANLNPAFRTGFDSFDNWFDKANDELFWGGGFNYFRFDGDATTLTDFDGESEVLLSFTRGSQTNPAPNLGTDDSDWWTAPDGSKADMWQSWNIGDPFVFDNGWTGSEDSGRFYQPVPEPVTMLGLFLAVGSLGGYIRKRQMA